MKYISNILLLIFLLSIISCSDFLDYKESDKMIPKTIENYSEFLYGEVILDKGNHYMKEIPFMTDDFSEVVGTSTSNEDKRLDLLSYYTWKKEIEVDYKGKIQESKPWANLYHKVLMCNIILNDIAELTEVEKESRERYILEGEALFLRANAYFKLINLYGEPYENEEQAKTALGVPINDAIGVSDKLHRRSSVFKVYQLIEEDLKKSIELFKKYKRNEATIFRPNLDAALLLLSRVYLYEKKNSKTIEVCNDLFTETSKTICDLSKLPESKFFVKDNTGILFTYEQWEYASVFTQYGKFYYRVSSDLMGLFSMNDLRKSAFFCYSYYHPCKAKSGYTNINGKVFRLEEAYLNMAEALIETDYKQAIDYINDIRRNRFKKDAENPNSYKVSAESKEEAWEVVKRERRVELCFELHRWFDLRRWGRPEIRHTYTNEDMVSSKVYVLEKNSPNYTLPIPDHVLKVNPYIENIKRVESKIE